jgi:hypothetical protein
MARDVSAGMAAQHSSCVYHDGGTGAGRKLKAQEERSQLARIGYLAR